MKMIVRYNGGKDSYNACSEPKELVVGQEYEVVSIEKGDWQTNYTLKGIKGKFNSVWFDEVSLYPPTYLAVSNKKPIVGYAYECSRMEYIDGAWKLSRKKTSNVKAVEQIGKVTYKVETLNSTYIVQDND